MNFSTPFLQGAELDVIPDMIMEGSFKHVGGYITQLIWKNGTPFFPGMQKNQGQRQNSVAVKCTCQIWSLSRVMDKDSIGFGSEPFGRIQIRIRKKHFESGSGHGRIHSEF
jgi:hypothetical protein